MRKIVAILSAVPLLALSPLASAQTCDDITFGSAITSRIPDISNACLDVVEMNGEQFVKMRAELTRDPRGNKATFRMINADGSKSESTTVELPSSWRANIEGRDYRLRDLSRGQELNIYLPPDRWAAHIAGEDLDAADIAPVALVDATPDEDTYSSSSLPATASPMPLFALFGGLALLAAGALRVVRRS